MIIILLVGYIGASRKKPVFCGWGLFLSAVGFFVFALPHFISPPCHPGKCSCSNVIPSSTTIITHNVTDPIYPISETRDYKTTKYVFLIGLNSNALYVVQRSIIVSEYQHNLILSTLPFRWLASRPSQCACG